MKIAIPLFETRVSPRFEYADKTLIVTVEESIVKDSLEAPLFNMDPLERIVFFKESGVSVIICGGVSRVLENTLKESRIDVIPWVTGEAQDALKLFLKHRLEPGTMICRGRRGRWRFCCHSRQGSGNQ